jgi:hypothetical protein
MNNIPLLHYLRPDPAPRAELASPATPDRPNVSGEATVVLHWTDLDVLVDDHLEGVSMCLSHPRDREAALFRAEEAVRLNQIARAAEVAQQRYRVEE